MCTTREISLSRSPVILQIHLQLALVHLTGLPQQVDESALIFKEVFLFFY